MLRVRNFIILCLITFVTYRIISGHRKKRLLDKIDKLVRSIALAILMYWLYMLGVFLWEQMIS